MVAKRRRKFTRMRGTRSHGWGDKKRHRGSGNRAGCGNASTGKRADAKKPTVEKIPHYFGKYGFKKLSYVEEQFVINLRDIEEMAGSWVSKKLAEAKDGIISVDLGKLGYTKLLSSGIVTKKLKIRVSYASAKAVEKVSKAGGAVELSAKPPKSGSSSPGKSSKPKKEQ